jgi:hypothetical protein
MDQQVEQAKTRVNEIIKNNNIQPNDLITLGKAAELVLKDKALYPMLIDKAKQLGISDVAQLNKSKVDYQVIATLITTGKLLEGK